MGRTMTNVIGNSVATAVIDKWETQRNSKSVASSESSSAYFTPLSGEEQQAQ